MERTKEDLEIKYIHKWFIYKANILDKRETCDSLTNRFSHGPAVK